MKEFEIMYEDLTPKAQKELCHELETNPKDENWDVKPVAVVKKED